MPICFLIGPCTVERPTWPLRQLPAPPMNTTIGRFFAVVVGTLLVVGCGQTSPTSPSSLLPSASSVGDARVTVSANSPLDIPIGAWHTLRASVVNDARGDSTSSSPYLDVVHANVIEQGHETLLFMMVLAGPIPEAPTEPFLLWVFHVDTDPNASPGGLYNEYIVRVRWNGVAFFGEVVDRTGAPTLITTPVPFSIDGATVKLVVELGTLGNPSSFGWNAATRPQPPAAYLDFAPDGGVQLATWTKR